MSLVVGTILCVTIGTVVVGVAGWLVDRSKAARNAGNNKE
jgi:hypothetical protein